MPPDEQNVSEEKINASTPAAASGRSQTQTPSFFTTPVPIQRLFKRFPLVTYPVNELPLRAPKHTDKHVLYVYTTPPDATAGAPSFNPGCLKWQTFLRFNDIPFAIRPSSNHASPSGILPFLVPSSKPAKSKSSFAITSTKLETWIRSQQPEAKTEHPSNDAGPDISSILRDTAYTSLLNRIRLAYLYALYLHPPTFTSIATPLYIAPCSENTHVRSVLSSPLRDAALEQVLAGAGGSGPLPKVEVSQLFQHADEAFEALSSLLGENSFFSQAGRHRVKYQEEARPGLLDAAVFAYTHVITAWFWNLDAWTPAGKLYAGLVKRHNLVRHRDIILERYFVRNRE